MKRSALCVLNLVLLLVVVSVESKSVGVAKWWQVGLGQDDGEPLIVGMPHSEKDKKQFMDALYAANAAGKCGICKLMKLDLKNKNQVASAKAVDESKFGGKIGSKNSSSDTKTPSFSVSAPHSSLSTSKSSAEVNKGSAAVHSSASVSQSPAPAPQAAPKASNLSPQKETSLQSTASGSLAAASRADSSASATHPQAAQPQAESNPYKREARYSSDYFALTARSKRKANANSPKRGRNESDLSGGMMQHDRRPRQ